MTINALDYTRGATCPTRDKSPQRARSPPVPVPTTMSCADIELRIPDRYWDN